MWQHGEYAHFTCSQVSAVARAKRVTLTQVSNLSSTCSARAKVYKQEGRRINEQIQCISVLLYYIRSS